MHKWIKPFLKALMGKTSKTGMLYFHRIVDTHDPYHPDDLTEIEFELLVIELKKRFVIVTPEDWLYGKIPPNRPSIMISFDDGFKDNLKAAAILEKHHVRGIFFVSTAWCNNDGKPNSLWHLTAAGATKNGHTISVPSLKFFPPNEIKKTLENAVVQSPAYHGLSQMDIANLSASGHSIGGHTRNHYILSTLTDSEALSEISGCYHDLRRIIGPHKPLFFAYPNGLPERDYAQKHAEMVSDVGFSAAFNTADGGFDIDKNKSDKYNLPRFLPHRKEPFWRSLACLKIIHEE